MEIAIVVIKKYNGNSDLRGKQNQNHIEFGNLISLVNVFRWHSTLFMESDLPINYVRHQPQTSSIHHLKGQQIVLLSHNLILCRHIALKPRFGLRGNLRCFVTLFALLGFVSSARNSIGEGVDCICDEENLPRLFLPNSLWLVCFP